MTFISVLQVQNILPTDMYIYKYFLCADTQQDNIKRRKYLPEAEKKAIYGALLASTINGKLADRDTTEIIAAMFDVTRRVVQDIWTKAKKCLAAGVEVDFKSKKPGNCGRKRSDIDLDQVLALPLNSRCSIRSLASALNASKSQVHRLVKEGALHRHSNRIKPYLKEANKKQRLEFCVSMLDVATLNAEPRFIDMQNIVHIDEKWFNATMKNKTFYLVFNEDEPVRCVQNKNAIDKVMFLSALAKPRYDEEGNCYFDGKIGIRPFVRKVKSQLDSICFYCFQVTL